MIAGSNPNNDVTTVKYATEYRVEWLSPAYLSQPRPTYTGIPATIQFNTHFNLAVTLPAGTTSVTGMLNITIIPIFLRDSPIPPWTVSLMDLGFQTHAVHMDQRLVLLTSTLSTDRKTLNVAAPPNQRVYPPGPAYLYVVTNTGVPSFGHKTIIGTGAGPPVDQGAIDK